jgi:hypothetical protein
VYLDSFTAPSGWVSSAVDLARFTAAIETHSPPGFDATPTDAGWPDKFYTLSVRESAYAKSQSEMSWLGLGWDGIWLFGADPGWSANQEFVVSAANPTLTNWWKTGGMPGTSSEIIVHSAGYTLTGLFNGSYPGQSIDGLLEDVLGAITSLPAVSYDLFPQYDGSYTPWQNASTFSTTLAGAASMGQYPSRVDGEVIGPVFPKCTPAQVMDDTCPPPFYVQRFRARLASSSSTIGAPTVLTNQSCSDMLTALGTGSGAVSGQVVSLQKFYDPTSADWRYQAVFAPLP